MKVYLNLILHLFHNSDNLVLMLCERECEG